MQVILLNVVSLEIVIALRNIYFNFSGFFCDIENLEQPVICSQGTFRLHTGGNNIDDILKNFPYLDFLDPLKQFYDEYQQFQTSKYYLDTYTPVYDKFNLNTDCMPCPPGFYCEMGTVKPKECPPGTYCVHQSFKPAICPQGSWNKDARQYKCQDCVEGQICVSEGLKTTSPCPPGYYCPEKKTGTTNSEYKLDKFKIAKK
jgi:hypothetical protein